MQQRQNKAMQSLKLQTQLEWPLQEHEHNQSLHRRNIQRDKYIENTELNTGLHGKNMLQLKQAKSLIFLAL